MNNTTLEKIISDTQSSPYIKWNDESLADLIRNDNGQIEGIIRYWLLAVLGKESKYFS